VDRQTEEPAMSSNAVLCDQPVGQGNDFNLIPAVSMESQHFVDGPNSRDSSSIYIVRELSPDEVGSLSRRSQFWERTTPCGKILKISFQKDSCGRGNTSCVQIS